MNIDLTLPPKLESAVRRRASEAGVDLDTYLSRYVAENLAEDEGPERLRLSPEEFMAKLRQIGAKLPPSTGQVDDSRESIYEDRGE